LLSEENNEGRKTGGDKVWNEKDRNHPKRGTAASELRNDRIEIPEQRGSNMMYAARREG